MNDPSNQELPNEEAAKLYFIKPEQPDFEPPKYLSSLIQAVNDGARATQAGALALAAAGIYLVSVSVSVTDEDLLLQHATSISQFGVQVAPQVAFGVGPVIFAALHIFTLIRYVMLSKNIAAFKQELHRTIPAPQDREKCFQLFSNDTFAMSILLDETSPLYSFLYRVVSYLVVALIPLSVLILLQLSALRYQSDTVLLTQKATLLVDAAVLVWFYRKIKQDFRAAPLINATIPQTRAFRPTIFRIVGLFILPVFISISEICWIDLPNGNENLQTDMIIFNSYHFTYPTPRYLPTFSDHIAMFLSQPIDYGLCNDMHFGCRYINVTRQFLVEREFSTDVASLRAQYVSQNESVFGPIEGVDLSNRHLVAANLNDDELYAADLSGDDLTSADFSRSALMRADLDQTILKNASFESSEMDSATFRFADLTGASFFNTSLNNADFERGTLTDVDFTTASLQKANFTAAKMQGATFACFEMSSLPCANLTEAIFRAANVSCITEGGFLDCASFESANLPGADFSCYIRKSNSAHQTSVEMESPGEFQGPVRLNKPSCTDLRGAIMKKSKLFCVQSDGGEYCAKFNGANLSCFSRTECTNLSAADLRGADFSCFVAPQYQTKCTNLEHVILAGAELTCETLSGATRCADFSGADMLDANLTGAKMNGADLSNADLRGAMLTCFVSKEKTLVCPDLTGVDFKNTNFQGAIYQKETIFPKG